MTIVKIYGIKNCDTMKKAFKWLEKHNIAYEFFNYKEGVDAPVIKNALTQQGWENVINKRGTTWRKLPKNTQEAMDNNNALETAIASPSIIKRPLLICNDEDIILGFNEEKYTEIFKI